MMSKAKKVVNVILTISYLFVIISIIS
ncbi:MAG TPA: hypothetical protein DEF35_15870 [Paenibacillus sp.]|nr:hypothetical protein [Paenibacillus sp.]